MTLSKLIVLRAQWKLGCLIVISLGDICRWAGMVKALCSSYRQTLPFIRISCYEIKPEVAFYSLPQSFKQTKKTVNSNLCSFKSLLYCDAYEKLRTGSWQLLSIVWPIWFCYYLVLPSCPHPISLSCKLYGISSDRAQHGGKWKLSDYEWSRNKKK